MGIDSGGPHPIEERPTGINHGKATIESVRYDNSSLRRSRMTGPSNPSVPKPGLMPFTELVKRLPVLESGWRVNVDMLRCWRKRGLFRAHLHAIRINGVWHSRIDWLGAFFKRVLRNHRKQLAASQARQLKKDLTEGCEIMVDLFSGRSYRHQ